MIITQVFQSRARPHVEQGLDRSTVDKLNSAHTNQRRLESLLGRA